jgi:hypothetical protein
MLHESQTLNVLSIAKEMCLKFATSPNNMLNLIKVKSDCLTLRDEGTLFLQNVGNQTTHTMTECHIPEDLNPHSAVISSNLKHNLNWHLKPRANCASTPSPSVHTHIQIMMTSRQLYTFHYEKDNPKNCKI